MTYDVAIVGAGTAGLAALREVRKSTDNFVLVNEGPYGTTCARVGCMPSKAIIEAANAFERRKAFGAFGIRGAEGLSADIPAVLRRVRKLRDGFVQGVLRATKELGERNIPGRARFVFPDTLDVEGRRVQARRIIIATGSAPVVPEPWHRLGNRVLTSDTIFEQDDLPPRIAVIGLGAIGVELAQALARLGIRVTGIELGDRIAGLSDPEVNTAAIAGLRTELPIHLGTRAEIAERGADLVVKSGDDEIVADKVLAALGRRPNLEGLGLERIGVRLDERGMPPFDPRTLQIDDMPIFIAGDANNRAPLLHEASDDGFIAGRNATASPPDCYERRTALAIVFTDPNIAWVGHRYESLDHGEAVIGTVDFSNQGRARMAARNHGVARIYADKHTGGLLGAELYAPAGEHWAHLLALAVGQRLDVRGLLRLPFYHPVLEEGLRTALRDLAGRLARPPASDLADCGRFDVEALD